jgi:hypothetical protein
MTPRQKRAFRKQWDSQIEQERNGAPLDPEVAARMTRPKDEDTLYQVNVTMRSDRTVRPFGPRMIQEAAGLFCEAINKQIVLGTERSFINAVVVPLTIIQGA